MEKILLKRTGKPPLKFQGELVAEAESSPDRASPRFQSTGRWTEVKIYRTAGGK